MSFSRSSRVSGFDGTPFSGTGSFDTQATAFSSTVRKLSSARFECLCRPVKPNPRAPVGRVNYCVNTAIQFYTAALRPLGHNIRLSPHTWDPQLSSPHPDCICNNGTFLGDYFGVDSRGGLTYTTSVETYNVSGENPGFHQQQLVSKLRTP